MIYVFLSTVISNLLFGFSSKYFSCKLTITEINIIMFSDRNLSNVSLILVTYCNQDIHLLTQFFFFPSLAAFFLESSVALLWCEVALQALDKLLRLDMLSVDMWRARRGTSPETNTCIIRYDQEYYCLFTESSFPCFVIFSRQYLD